MYINPFRFFQEDLLEQCERGVSTCPQPETRKKVLHDALKCTTLVAETYEKLERDAFEKGRDDNTTPFTPSIAKAAADFRMAVWKKGERRRRDARNGSAAAAGSAHQVANWDHGSESDVDEDSMEVGEH